MPASRCVTIPRPWSCTGRRSYDVYIGDLDLRTNGGDTRTWEIARYIRGAVGTWALARRPARSVCCSELGVRTCRATAIDSTQFHGNHASC